MATSKTRVKNRIKTALEAQAAKTQESQTPEQSRDELATILSEIIVDEILAITIQISATAGPYPLTVQGLFIS